MIDPIDPAFRDAEQLQVALVDQETGVRGYVLAGQEVFLRAVGARRRQRRGDRAIRRAVRGGPVLGIRPDLDGVRGQSRHLAHAVRRTAILAQVRGRPTG